MLVNIMTPVIAILSWSHLLIILLILLLVFGAARIPEIARALGKAIQEFKKGAKEVDDEVDAAVKDKDKPKEDSEKKPEPKS